jgi:putative flippase GtrA
MRFLGFVVAGGIATVVNYTVFAMLLLADLHYLAASAIGYVSGIAVSFAINRRYVFRSVAAPGGQLVRYASAYGVALFAQLALLELLVRLSIPPLFANGLALVIVVIGNYFLVARVVFPEGVGYSDESSRHTR